MIKNIRSKTIFIFSLIGGAAIAFPVALSMTSCAKNNEDKDIDDLRLTYDEIINYQFNGSGKGKHNFASKPDEATKFALQHYNTNDFLNSIVAYSQKGIANNQFVVDQSITVDHLHILYIKHINNRFEFSLFLTIHTNVEIDIDGFEIVPAHTWCQINVYNGGSEGERVYPNDAFYRTNDNLINEIYKGNNVNLHADTPSSIQLEFQINGDGGYDVIIPIKQRNNWTLPLVDKQWNNISLPTKD